MAKILARDVNFLWGGTGVDKITSWSLSGSAGTISQTDYDSTGQFAEAVAGTRDATVSVDFNADSADSENIDEMAADWIAGTSQAWQITGANSGDIILSGNGFITSFDWSGGSVDDTTTVSATIQNTGVVTQTAVV